MKKTATLALCLMALATAFAQKFDPDCLIESYFTDGDIHYYGNRYGDLYNFSGGTSHEGGYAFGLVHKNGVTFEQVQGWFSVFEGETPGTYRIFGSDDGDVDDEGYRNFNSAAAVADFIKANGTTSSRGGNIVQYRSFGGKSFLLFGYGNDETDYALARYDGKLTDYQQQMLAKLLLSGVYTDPNGKKYTFWADKMEISGFGSQRISYKFGSSLEMVTNVIVLQNGKKYWFETSPAGMNLYTATFDEDQDTWAKGGLQFKLTKQKSMYPSKKPGLYPFASEEIIPTGILSFFSKEQLKVMRNEIYARYGMTFQTKSLNDYLATQSWYKPMENSGATEKLTEIEKINVQLIKSAESQP